MWSWRPNLKVLLLAISGLLLVHRPAAAKVISVTVPFMGPGGSYVTQQERYHTYRIPGMIVASDGSILAFAEARRGDGDDPRIDENAPIDIVMRRSSDHGESWQPQIVIESGFRPHGKLADFGDPTPLRDAMTGTIFLFYGQWADVGPRVAPHGQSVAPDDGHQTLWFRSSQDNGRSWSDRQQVVYPDKPEDTPDGLYWRYVEPGPGNGIQLKWQERPQQNGRLLVPVRRAGSSTPTGSVTVEPFVYYSDDHGKTWQAGNMAPGPSGNESEVVELTDGQVLLDARQDKGKFRRRHFSTDGGLTWGPDIPDSIPLPQVDASLARCTAKRDQHDRDRILFAAPRGLNGLNRNRISVWTSYDEGRSFVGPVQFNNAFAAYSVVQRLADGSIGLLVETGGDADDQYGAITFYRFDLAELDAGGSSP